MLKRSFKILSILFVYTVSVNLVAFDFNFGLGDTESKLIGKRLQLAEKICDLPQIKDMRILMDLLQSSVDQTDQQKKREYLEKIRPRVNDQINTNLQYETAAKYLDTENFKMYKAIVEKTPGVSIIDSSFQLKSTGIQIFEYKIKYAGKVFTFGNTSGVSVLTYVNTEERFVEQEALFKQVQAEGEGKNQESRKKLQKLASTTVTLNKKSYEIKNYLLQVSFDPSNAYYNRGCYGLAYAQFPAESVYINDRKYEERALTAAEEEQKLKLSRFYRSASVKSPAPIAPSIPGGQSK